MQKDTLDIAALVYNQCCKPRIFNLSVKKLCKKCKSEKTALILPSTIATIVNSSLWAGPNLSSARTIPSECWHIWATN